MLVKEFLNCMNGCALGKGTTSYRFQIWPFDTKMIFNDCLNYKVYEYEGENSFKDDKENYEKIMNSKVVSVKKILISNITNYGTHASLIEIVIMMN